MDEELYDEFGNYIGPEVAFGDEDSDDGAETYHDDNDVEGQHGRDVQMDVVADETAVVLHENKKYYPSALEVYGEDVQTAVQEEDSQPISQPVIAPMKTKEYDLVEERLPQTVYPLEFLTSLMPHGHLIRNIVIVGHMQHGKTTLVDNLIGATHIFAAPLGSEGGTHSRKKVDKCHYTDTRADEQKRGLSIKTMPITLLLQTSKEKHYVFNLMDTPGHTNFSDEVRTGF